MKRAFLYPTHDLKVERTPELNRRGLKPPIHCHHCSRVIHGWVNWIGKEPYCSYCYGFRAVLKTREKREKLDPKTKEKLKKRKLNGDQE